MALFSTKENLFFMAGHFATDLCHGSMPIILAYMYQQGRLDSYSSVALLMMANTILNALIQPIAGNLADSKPRPYLMSIGIAFAFLGVMFIGTVQNQILLYSLVCLNGIGSPIIFHKIDFFSSSLNIKTSFSKRLLLANASIASFQKRGKGIYILLCTILIQI